MSGSQSPRQPAVSQMRLFIALPLPGPTRAALGKIMDDLQPTSNAVRWVKPENTHLTLRFLGDTNPSLLPALIHLINRAAKQQAALELKLDQLGAFPGFRKARVYWISTTDSTATEHLADLATQIGQGVRELGFQAEQKRFKPHLTLGRVKQPDNLAGLAQAMRAYRLPPLVVPLTRIALIHSTLTPRGANYQTLHESSLVGGQQSKEPRQ